MFYNPFYVYHIKKYNIALSIQYMQTWNWFKKMHFQVLVSNLNFFQV